MKTRRLNTKGILTLAVAFLLVVLIASMAMADVVHYVLATNSSLSIKVNETTTIGYYIQATGGDTNNGCNVDPNHPATITINTPDGIQADPTSLSLTACHEGNDKNIQYVVFKPSKGGSFYIPVTVSGGVGTTDPSQAAVTILVTSTDSTAPVVTASPDRPTDNGEWYNHPLTVSFSGTDEPGDTVTCDAPVTYAGSDTNTASVTGHCKDAAGNEGTATFTFEYDATAPTNVSGAPNRNPDFGGWYNHTVDVVFTGEDATSGIASCTTVNYSAPDLKDVSVSGFCKDKAGNASASVYSSFFNYDGTGPTAVVLSVTAGTTGTNGWYTSDVTVSTSGSDNISGPVTCTTDQYQTAETAGAAFSGSCKNDAGLSTDAASLTVKLDKTGPTAALDITAGNLGNNGWYTSNVTISTTGNDDISEPVTCTPDQFQTVETTGVTFNGSCTNDAGLKTEADALSVKLDKTGPSAVLSVPGGTAGTNGWYTSDVTVSTSGLDTISGPVTCTADQYQTTETAGTVFNGSCKNDAGLSTDAAPLTVKLDKTGPSAALAVTAGTLGNNGWYTSDVTISTTGSDNISSPVTCTVDQHQTTETTGASYNGSCANDAGLSTAAAALTVKLDKNAPSLAPSISPYPVILNSSATASPNPSDLISGVASSNCGAVNTSSVGSHSVTCTATDNAGNTSSKTINYNVIYRWDGFLQPINDTAHNIGLATSIFKGGSTVPVKFQLKDANGNVVQASSAPVWITPVKGSPTTAAIDEITYSDPATGGGTYRWDATAQQYIYNWSSKGSSAGFYYRIGVTFDDGQTYYVNIGLR